MGVPHAADFDELAGVAAGGERLLAEAEDHLRVRVVAGVHARRPAGPSRWCRAHGNAAAGVDERGGDPMLLAQQAKHLVLGEAFADAAEVEPASGGVKDGGLGGEFDRAPVDEAARLLDGGGVGQPFFLPGGAPQPHQRSHGDVERAAGRSGEFPRPGQQSAQVVAGGVQPPVAGQAGKLAVVEVV